jgi:hypothetical protein
MVVMVSNTFFGLRFLSVYLSILDCFLPVIDQAALVSLPIEVAHVVHSSSTIWLACMY